MNVLTAPAFVNSIPALLGAAAVATLLGGAGGYALGHRVASADGDAALAKLTRDHATATAAANAQAREKEYALTAAAKQLGRQLDAERSAHAQETQQLKGRIPRVTTQYRPAPDAPLQPAPRCVFTRGFASVWNDAISAAGASPVPPSDPPGELDDPAGAAEALDSGIQQADILGHIADYGARCRNMESQLNRLIDLQLKTEAP